MSHFGVPVIRRLRLARRHWAWAAVIIMAAVNLVFTYAWRASPQVHGLADTILICLVVVAAVRQFAGPRLKPGQVIVSVEDFQRAEQLQKESIAQAHGDRCILQEKRNQRDAQPGLLGA